MIVNCGQVFLRWHPSADKQGCKNPFHLAVPRFSPRLARRRASVPRSVAPRGLLLTVSPHESVTRTLRSPFCTFQVSNQQSKWLIVRIGGSIDVMAGPSTSDRSWPAPRQAADLDKTLDFSVLKDQCVLITGGSSGMGAIMVDLFTEHG